MFKNKLHDVSPNTAHAQRTDGHGNVVEEKVLQLDPYKDLLKEDGFASVSCSITAVQPGSYGGKVSFMVTIRCDQNETAINTAGERAFQKVTEFCTDAVTLLGWDKLGRT